jgi:hypothetical protein
MAPPEDTADAEPQPSPRPLRGHFAKIAEAVAELCAEGKLLPNMRTSHRDKLVLDRIDTKGHGKDRPSRQALARFFARVNT